MGRSLITYQTSRHKIMFIFVWYLSCAGVEVLFRIFPLSSACTILGIPSELDGNVFEHSPIS